MILPASIFAYDTETDRLDPDDPETTYCALVQICPIDAQSVDDVTLIESDHAVDDFLAAFEKTPYNCEMHCYNLDELRVRVASRSSDQERLLQHRDGQEEETPSDDVEDHLR